LREGLLRIDSRIGDLDTNSVSLFNVLFLRAGSGALISLTESSIIEHDAAFWRMLQVALRKR
jgi:hypothetical protein